MEDGNKQNITISVRRLVEFILSSGNLDNREGRRDAFDAMQQGSRLHKKIQKSMGVGYSAEVPLSITVEEQRDGTDFSLCIEGRADGIFTNDDGITVIDEIKGVYREVSRIEEPVPVHRAQAMCYAYMYLMGNKKAEKTDAVAAEARAEKSDAMAAKAGEEQSDVAVAEALTTENGEPIQIGIRLTYSNLESDTTRYFEEIHTYESLRTWFTDLTHEYFKWAAWQYHWNERRNESIKKLQFPFEYRPGQKDLVSGVYRTILRKKKLFIEAPTGVGKTISTVFPTVKSMGEGLTEKIFYVTAKTITRTVAEETFRILDSQGLAFKLVTLTAKDKVCVLDKPDCNPDSCERACGHYDRVNDAVFDLLTNETGISRDLILAYAEKHCVCPFEMCLDVTLWADGVICDYNYVFDPNVYLRRFFANEEPRDYCFLIDEAHNLVERAREMYSATLIKQSFLDIKRMVKESNQSFVRCLEQCNTDLLRMKRECDECEVLAEIDGFALHLMKLMTEFDEFLQERINPADKEQILLFYLDVRHFLHMYELLDDNYIIFADYNEEEQFRLRLMCMDPSKNLKTCLEKGRSAVFFSATLLPISYYREQLGGEAEDYAIYAPSPFLPERRLLMIGKDVSTKYTRRGVGEYRKIGDYIKAFVGARTGNYFVFFPSYQMMNAVAEVIRDELPGLIMQTNSMREKEREEFLQAFSGNESAGGESTGSESVESEAVGSESTGGEAVGSEAVGNESAGSLVGFCVLGGIFSEGIDLKNDRLIGAVVVGTGLPMVCNERELFRGFYDERNGHGFDYSYLYNGMNKVQQAAGRVIRTMEDRGAILLLDERFQQTQYHELFPREWYPHEVVDLGRMKQLLNEFWS